MEAASEYPFWDHLPQSWPLIVASGFKAAQDILFSSSTVSSRYRVSHDDDGIGDELGEKIVNKKEFGCRPPRRASKSALPACRISTHIQRIMQRKSRS
jgi:hypothetical protein